MNCGAFLVCSQVPHAQGSPGLTGARAGGFCGSGFGKTPSHPNGGGVSCLGVLARGTHRGSFFVVTASAVGVCLSERKV